MAELKSERKEKRIWLRTALLVFFALLAVVSFTIGVLQYIHREPGYYDIELNDEAKSTAFGSGLSLTYYASGSSSEIRRTVAAAQDAFSVAALQAYQLLDATQEYAGLNNLATLCLHPGEAVRLPQRLFRVLQDAQGKLGQGLCSGALWAEWQTLRYLEEPESADPLVNPSEAERLLAVTKALEGGNAPTLTLDETDGTATLTVPEGYQRVMEEWEIEAPPITLGALQQAYLIDLTAQALREAGFNQGCLMSESGVGLAMDLPVPVSLRVCRYDETGQREIDSLKITGNTAYAQYCAFPLEGEVYGKYSVATDGVTRWRGAWTVSADPAGLFPAETVALVRPGTDAAEVAIRLLRCAQAETREQLAQELESAAGSGYALAAIWNEETLLEAGVRP